MALIGNVFVLRKASNSLHGGAIGNWSYGGFGNYSTTAFYKLARFTNIEESPITTTTSIPDGYSTSGLGWALESGGIASFNRIIAEGNFYPNNPGSSSTINGEATVASNISSLLQAIASLSGSGSVGTANLGAVVSLVSNIVGTGVITSGDLRALANMIAEISVTSVDPLSPGNLAAAVWNAVAADYNVTGTTGKTLKDIKTNTGLIPALL